MMNTQTPTTPSRPICKKGPPGRIGEVYPSEARVYIKTPYQIKIFQFLSLKLYILNRFAEHLKSPRVCTAIS